MMIDSFIIKKLKITGIIQETRDAKTFGLAPVDGWNPSYYPGQFLTLVFYTKHGEKRRSYSISSVPSLNEDLSITVKKVDNGEFSRLLIQHAKVGDILYTTGVSGFFRLPESPLPTTHYCFLAAGSGITPCYSLIRSILSSASNKVTLIYSNRSKDDVIFYEALLKLQQQYPARFRIRFLFGNSNDVYNKRLSRWLLDQLLVEYLGEELPHARFYLCGPYEYMQTAEITLLMHADAKNIVKENFSSLPRMVIPKPPDTEAHLVTIKIGGHSHTLMVQYPRSVLATAKAAGIELPYSCEAGRCGSCIASCTKGKMWMAYNEILVDREVENGRVLICQSYPVHGDAEIIFD